jgi:hypothetical protein
VGEVAVVAAREAPCGRVEVLGEGEPGQVVEAVRRTGLPDGGDDAGFARDVGEAQSVAEGGVEVVGEEELEGARRSRPGAQPQVRPSP